jgi:hypothetical protein
LIITGAGNAAGGLVDPPSESDTVSFWGVTADFSVSPASVARGRVEQDRCVFTGDRAEIGAGGGVTLCFEVARPRDIPFLVLRVDASVSPPAPAPERAPVEVVFQGETLAWNPPAPHGRDERWDIGLVLPGRLLVAGTNTVEIRALPGAEAAFGLHRLTVETETAARLPRAPHVEVPGAGPASVLPSRAGASRTEAVRAFRAFARRHGVPEDTVTRLLWMMEPAVPFEWRDPENVRPEDRVIGHVGGLPELPLDAEWEEGDIFVACFDLAAVPGHLLGDDLPREGGILLFTREDACGGRVLFVPPGTATAVREAPVPEDGDGDPDENKDAEAVVLERWALVASAENAWDVRGWVIDEDYWEEGPDRWDDEEEKAQKAQLAAALKEFTSATGVEPPLLRTNDKLLGVPVNPGNWDISDREFQRLREEAVVELRNDPARFEERFGELYERALRGGPGGEPMRNIATFAMERLRYGWGEGEISWLIRRDDLRAGRFDLAEVSWSG